MRAITWSMTSAHRPKRAKKSAYACYDLVDGKSSSTNACYEIGDLFLANSLCERSAAAGVQSTTADTAIHAYEFKTACWRPMSSMLWLTANDHRPMRAMKSGSDSLQTGTVSKVQLPAPNPQHLIHILYQFLSCFINLLQ